GISSAPGILRAEREALRRTDTVHLDEYAIAADAADGEVLIAGPASDAQCRSEPRRSAANRHTRFEADKILDVGCQLVGNLLVGNHSDRGRRVDHLNG